MAKLNVPVPDNNPYDKDATIDWLLQELIKHGGQKNLYTSHGANAPRSNDIIWAQDLLSSQGYIRRVDNAIGVTFAISEEGKQHFYKRVYDKVLVQLAKESDFTKVSSILADLRIEDDDDELANAIEAKLVREDNVFATEESGIMLKPGAKDDLLQTKFGLKEKNPSVAIHNDHSVKVGGDYIHAPENTGQILNKSTLTEASVSQQINPESKEPKKKHWLLQGLKWVWEQIKKPIGAALTATIVTALTTLKVSQSCNRLEVPKQSQSTTQQTSKDTSVNAQLLDSGRNH